MPTFIDLVLFVATSREQKYIALMFSFYAHPDHHSYSELDLVTYSHGEVCHHHENFDKNEREEFIPFGT